MPICPLISNNVPIENQSEGKPSISQCNSSCALFIAGKGCSIKVIAIAMSTKKD